MGGTRDAFCRTGPYQFGFQMPRRDSDDESGQPYLQADEPPGKLVAEGRFAGQHCWDVLELVHDLASGTRHPMMTSLVPRTK